MQLIDGYEILAKTKWHRQSTSRLRPCRRCSKLFPSTNDFERTCPACHKVMDGIRARAVTTSKDAQFRELVEGIFDEDMLDRRNWARRFDEMKRLEAAHEALVQLGLGSTETAKSHQAKVKEIRGALFPPKE